MFMVITHRMFILTDAFLLGCQMMSEIIDCVLAMISLKSEFKVIFDSFEVQLNNQRVSCFTWMCLLSSVSL